MKSNDLTNTRFGKLVVLGIDPDHKYNSSNKLVWKCRCDCGTVCYKTLESLKRPIKTPGVKKACSKKCGTSLSVGDKFERLTVVEVIFKENQETQCRCKCECGNEIITTQQRLKNGSTKSCGCYKNDKMSLIGKSQMVDISNQRYGKLTAIKPTNKRKNRSVVWECLCDCGNTHFAPIINLKNGDVTRCSDCHISSKGEEKISKLLKENNLLYEREKTFETCRNPMTNALLRFDFFVDNSYLIEFDGSQHFQVLGWNTPERLASTQLRDSYKTQWCQENNIPLIRIPYTALEFLDISDLNPKTTNYLIERK